MAAQNLTEHGNGDRATADGRAVGATIEHLLESMVQERMGALVHEVAELRSKVEALSRRNTREPANLTLIEAADRVRRHRNTVRDWIKNEKNPLPAEKVGRKWQIKRSDLDAYRPDLAGELDLDRVARQLVASALSNK